MPYSTLNPQGLTQSRAHGKSPTVVYLWLLLVVMEAVMVTAGGDGGGCGCGNGRKSPSYAAAFQVGFIIDMQSALVLPG